MRCDEARALISPHIDHETTASEGSALMAHAETCVQCSHALVDFRDLSEQLKSAGRVAAPAELKSRIQSALAAETPIWSLLNRIRSHVAQAAVLAAACLLTAVLTWAVMRPWVNEGRLEQDVLSAHIRSLLQDKPFQVASGDPHNVKPWFSGRVEFAPDVKDLATEGFPLVGARLDYIDGRRVGVLVYMRRQHVVNVFVWPSSGSGDMEQRLIQMNGYNLVSWRRGGLAYWAASDLSAGELRQLVSLL
jgi:anti-sigma factor RsiW